MTTSIKHLTAALAPLVAALALTGTADAIGGSYTVEGGTADQQQTVRSALQATKFNWSCVPATIRIVLRDGVESQAVPGTILLDTNLLDAGVFSWGVVQHEYAHQVDWYVLRPDVRTALAKALGGRTWGAGLSYVPGVAHDDQTGERFASELAWAFWPTADNSVEPVVKTFTAKAFRGLLGALLKPSTSTTATAPVAQPAAAQATAPTSVPAAQ